MVFSCNEIPLHISSRFLSLFHAFVDFVFILFIHSTVYLFHTSIRKFDHQSIKCVPKFSHSKSFVDRTFLLEILIFQMEILILFIFCFCNISFIHGRSRSWQCERRSTGKWNVRSGRIVLRRVSESQTLCESLSLKSIE